ncbi:MAG TPA: diaminopimelate epimerase [Actinomycetota bacterium]|nr:diaminopimelate epimerase [Actinomycetota bacterium]
MTRTIEFSKYHGIGNDFVMIADPGDAIELSPEDVKAMCDRRFGIGGDGIIRVTPGSDGAELFMDYVNSDGSLGEMCGNGIRCLAVFAREQGMTQATTMKVGTRAGVKILEVLEGFRVRVDMGPPIFGAPDIPVLWDGDPLHAKIELDDQVLEAACVGMGNPHAVMFVEDPATAPVTTLGPRVEHHPMFPNGTNVEFVRVDAPGRVTMRVWERGSGETLACGTGAAAVAVVARLLGGTRSDVTVALPGGELELSWDGSLGGSGSVLMTGPVAHSFSGTVDLDELIAR